MTTTDLTGLKEQSLRSSFNLSEAPDTLVLSTYVYIIAILTGAAVALTVHRNLSIHLVLFCFACLVSSFLYIKWMFGKIRKQEIARLSKGQVSESETQCLILRGADFDRIPMSDVKIADQIFCEAGQIIPFNGRVIDGVALVDESAVTGESAPVLREAKDQYAMVTAGTRLISNRLLIQVTSITDSGIFKDLNTLLDERARKYSKSEKRIRRSLLWLTAIGFVLFVVIAVEAFYQVGFEANGFNPQILFSVAGLCLFPLWMLLPMERMLGSLFIAQLLQRNIIPRNLNSVETAANVTSVFLPPPDPDHNMTDIAVDFLPVAGVTTDELASAAQLASLADPSDKGKSIVLLAKNKYAMRAQAMQNREAQFLSSSGSTGLIGMNLFDAESEVEHSIFRGSPEAVIRHVRGLGGNLPRSLTQILSTIESHHGVAELVCEGKEILGAIHLQKSTRQAIDPRVEYLQRAGIRLHTLLKETEVSSAYDFPPTFAAAKLQKVRDLQDKSEIVAMVGFEDSDLPSLAQADVGIVQNSRSQDFRRVGDFIDLKSRTGSLIDILSAGRALNSAQIDLIALMIAGATGFWIALLPLAGRALDSVSPTEPGFPWFTNPLYLGSLQSAIVSSSLATIVLVIAAMKWMTTQRKRSSFLRPPKDRFSFLFNSVLLFLFVILGTIKLMDFCMNEVIRLGWINMGL
jgi:K+-transporting ATPase ATPase B chain